MKQSLITVIIPSYNSEKFIKNTLESVLNQTYQNFEIIVTDDGSTDSTIRICETYCAYPNFNLIKNNHSGNIAKVRNISIDSAKGEYVAFLDSDDIWEPNKINEQMKYIDKFDFICSNAKIIDENNNVLSESYFTNLKNVDEINLENLLKENLIITSSVLSRKELIVNGGYFSENFGNLAEDYALWLKIANKYSIKYLNTSLLKYRKHYENISSKNDFYREDMLLKTIKLRNEYIHSENISLQIAARKGIIVIRNELIEIYFKNNKFIRSLYNIFYILYYFSPKLSVKYIDIYIRFLLLFVKKIFKGVFLSKK